MRLSTPSMDGRTLFVSFKISEACNLVCDYCYFFFKGDDSYRLNPRFISQQMVQHVAHFLGQGASQLGIKNIAVALHGGEPLLVGKKRFVDYCNILQSVNEFATLNLGVQTNGIPLDEEWIEIFSRFNVKLGISIDGPKSVNDAVRVDRKGKGSYDKVVKAIRLAQEAHRCGLIGELGALAVIRPNTSAREIYHHLVHELNLWLIDFMLPKDNWDSHDPEFTRFMERYSLELMECWLEDDNPKINIRSIKQIFAPFLTDLGLGLRTNYLADLTEAITIRSNGDVSPDDTLPALGPEFLRTGFNVATSTLRDFYDAPLWDDIRATVTRPPTECMACKWMGFCGGGEIVTRYSRARRFDNPTIYCQRNQLLYERVQQYIGRYVDPAIIEQRIQKSREVMFARPPVLM